jgi:hypothetical protein
VLVNDSTMKNSSDFRNWKSSENESIDKNTSASRRTRHEERENGLFNDIRKEKESKRKDR